MLAAAARRVSPASFTVAMATGIVAIGAHLEDVAVVDDVLLAITIAVYGGLWLLTGIRLARDRAAVLADFTDHRRGVASLAIVAATCVLGAQMVMIVASVPIATVLLLVGAVLWLGLGYAVFTSLTISRDKPSLAEGINGGWLLAVVATQSIAALLALLSAHWQQPLRLDADFAAVSLWLFGGLLYVWIAGLIIYRYAFMPVAPADLTPQHWINMGAMAVSARAGALLIDDASVAPFLASLRPFLEGLTVACWATATWWIPLLAVLTVWRYGVRRVPVGYDSLYWSAVFPLGMYAVSTSKLADTTSVELLHGIGHAFFWVALAAWALAFVGMVRSVAA